MLALPLAMTFPMLWAHSPSRIVAAMVSAGYFLAASRGLPAGVANFYAADLWPGLLLWLAASIGFVAVYSALWTSRPGRNRIVRFGLAALLVAVPPFGIVGWAHPITAAGVLLPGWGWVGLAAVATIMLVMTTRGWPIATMALGGLYAWSALAWTPPTLLNGWRGLDLEQGSSLGRGSDLDRQRDLVATARRAAGEGARVVVLPESALGLWTPTIEHLWRNELRGLDVTVIAGAAVIDRDGYDNVMVAISAGESRILYRERMPVPVSMWQPWLAWTGQGGGAHAHMFANAIVEVGGKRVVPLICYEQLILWPVLHSMLHSPDIIIATGNGWWTAGTSIVAIQKASTIAWARLFGVPVVIAFNT